METLTLTPRARIMPSLWEMVPAVLMYFATIG